MIFALLAGFWLIGWWVSMRLTLSPRERIQLAYPLGVGVTGVVFQSLWFAGVPFSSLWMIWWSVVFLGTLLLWKRIRWTSLHRNLQKFRDSSQTLVQELLKQNLRVNDWPWVLIGSVIVFSASIIFLWAWTVRPVGWDNLTLYEGRAQLIAHDSTRIDLLNEFRNVPDARRYDWLHPLAHSMVSAHFLRSGVEWNGVWVWVLFSSTVSLALTRLRTWNARLVFLLFLFGSRLVFEQAIESYASWAAALFWLAAFILWPPKKTLVSVLPAAVCIFCGLSWRSSEPYWLAFVVSTFLLGSFAGLVSKKVTALLPMMVLSSSALFAVLSWRLIFVPQSDLFPVGAAITAESFNPSTFLTRLLEFPLWSLIGVASLLVPFVQAKKAFFHQYRDLLFLVLSLSGLGLLGTLMLPYMSTLSWQDVGAAWPRVVLVPAVLLLWCIALLVEQITLEQKKV